MFKKITLTVLFGMHVACTASNPDFTAAYRQLSCDEIVGANSPVVMVDTQNITTSKIEIKNSQFIIQQPGIYHVQFCIVGKAYNVASPLYFGLLTNNSMTLPSIIDNTSLINDIFVMNGNIVLNLQKGDIVELRNCSNVAVPLLRDRQKYRTHFALLRVQ